MSSNGAAKSSSPDAPQQSTEAGCPRGIGCGWWLREDPSATPMRPAVQRRASLSANMKFGVCQKCCQTPSDVDPFVPFCQEKLVKQWSSVDSLASRAQDSNDLSPPGDPCFLSLNVGGQHFRVAIREAAKYPLTRIGRLATCADPVKKLELCDDYSVRRSEYFFDRDPLVFHYVFHFYRSGVLWVLTEFCSAGFLEEMEYWGVPLKHAQRCCRTLFEEQHDEMVEGLKVQRELEAELETAQKAQHFEGRFLGQSRKAVWNLVENPYSSPLAKVTAILSSLCVLFSVVGMTLSTVAEMQGQSTKRCLERMEAACAVFFTLEYLLRLASSSSPRQFLRAAFSAIDLVSILPFYAQVAFEYLGEEEEEAQELHPMRDVGKLGKVLKLVKLLRIFRILKLARHSTGVRAFGFTLRQCCQPVCCLLLFIAMGIFTFSALMHSVEHDAPGTNFTSIPDAWWWAAVSLSTVGYGDTVPDTFLGRVVAFGCIAFGIILNGMPISILYSKFSDYYAKLKSHQDKTTVALKTPRKHDLKERLWKKMKRCCC